MDVFIHAIACKPHEILRFPGASFSRVAGGAERIAEIKTIANRQSAIFCVLVDKRVLKILEKSKG